MSHFSEYVGRIEQKIQDKSDSSDNKNVFPDAMQAYKKIYSGLLPGHYEFSEYLHGFNCKEDPFNCKAESRVNESAEHVVFEGQGIQRQRNDLELETGEQ